MTESSCKTDLNIALSEALTARAASHKFPYRVQIKNRSKQKVPTKLPTGLHNLDNDLRPLRHCDMLTNVMSQHQSRQRSLTPQTLRHVGKGRWLGAFFMTVTDIFRQSDLAIIVNVLDKEFGEQSWWQRSEAQDKEEPNQRLQQVSLALRCKACQTPAWRPSCTAWLAHSEACSTTCIPDWTSETNSSDPAVLQPRHILLSQLCLVAPEPLPHHATTANYESLCLPAGRTITPFRPQESASYTGLFQAMCPSWKPGLEAPSVSCEYVSNRNAEKRLLSSPRARSSTANKDLTASKATQPCGLFLTSHDAHDL